MAKLRLLNISASLLIQVSIADLMTAKISAPLTDLNPPDTFCFTVALPELKAIQRRYGISISAIIFRLKVGGILSETQVKNFFISLNSDKAYKEQVNKSRFNSEEQSERFERLVYRVMEQELISTSKASAYLHQTVQEVKNNFVVI